MLKFIKVCCQPKAEYLFLTFMEWRILMSHIKKILVSFLLSIVLISLSLPPPTVSALSSNSIAFIILSKYSVTSDIGDEFHVVAITSTGKLASFKSSDSKIVSVNTYGKVTVKKAGTAIIIAKIKNAEACCTVTVNKTKVAISNSSARIERGEFFKLSATTSNDSNVIWKSSKKSIATVDEYGAVTGIKPGETTIIATADGTSATCTVTVNSPTVNLSQSAISLYRGQTVKLSATVSSKVNPTWKTNKKSVAIVDEKGTIIALKNGTAIITATVDGISKRCEVRVEKPDITLSSTDLTLTNGSTALITATVSSGNSPTWSTSNSNIVTVDSRGQITALQKGKAYIYATEDGTKVRCTIYVTN